MDIGDCIRELESIAPPALADASDAGRIGLVIEGASRVEMVACALDATVPVVRAASDAGADLLVVHHTPIYRPITTVTGDIAQILRIALASDLNIYVMHTNFDRAPGGVNDHLARILELENQAPLSLGVVGDCPLTIPEISRRLGCGLRVTGRAALPGRLAVVGGSGFDPDIIGEAVGAGADAFLSAELKHHVFRGTSLPCIEATHYALEAPAMEALAARRGWMYLADPPDTAIYP
ncbi:MAG: Nif3-like dinuclear metal center hexameric protein [Methanomicrobiales archaeon]